MSEQKHTKCRTGFCIYIDTFFQGSIPTVSDEDGHVVFETELEAQKNIADNMMIQLEQFMEGERDFMDATPVDEYVVPVTVGPDGVITDESGRCYGPLAK